MACRFVCKSPVLQPPSFLLRRYFSSSSVRALVVAQHDNKTLFDVTLNSVTAAKALGGDVTVLVAGHQCNNVAQEAAKINGVNKVLLSEHEGLSHFIAEKFNFCSC